jgi:ceramide glucosyltransferase
MIALTIACVAWAVVAAGFTLVAIASLRALDARRPQIDGRTDWPAIALIRPCEGLDAGLEENLLASVTAPYEGARSVWICVPSPADPAYAVAERVRARAAAIAPSVPVELVVTAINTTANRKAAQLAVAAARAHEPVLVLADSDVQLEPRTLPSLVAALQADPRAGAASAPPIDVRSATLGDHVSAALLSSTPNALRALAALSSEWRGHPLLAGALMACRRDALDAVGGFAALEPYLGEDFELARRLHAAGCTLAVSAEPARFTDSGRSLRQVVRRYARWAMVVRRQRPGLFVTYWLLLGCTPLVLAATAAAAALGAPGWPFAAAAAALLVGARAAFARAMRRSYGLGHAWAPSLTALLTGELLIVGSAARALGRAHVEWRGRRFRVLPGGRLQPLVSASPPARSVAQPDP